MSGQNKTTLKADFEKFDIAFADWKKKNPCKQFSDYSTQRIDSGLKKGRAHCTLGLNIAGDVNWWDHGRPAFKSIMEQVAIPTDAKVLEIGCGSARVGVHFIERQDTGCYYGLDVTDAFFAYCPDLIGELLIEKKAKFGVIPEKLEEAISWNADLVFSTAVTLHVCPEEEDAHFSTIKKIAHQQEASIVLQSYLYEKNIRFSRSGWARPQDYFSRLMHPFVLVNSMDDGVWESNGYVIDVKFLTFRRV